MSVVSLQKLLLTKHEIDENMNIQIKNTFKF